MVICNLRGYFNLIEMRFILVLILLIIQSSIALTQTLRGEIDSVFKIVNKHTEDSTEVIALIELGHLFHDVGNYDSSILFHSKALSLALSNGFSLQVSLAYQGISKSLLWQSKYDSAKLYLTKAEAVSKKNNDFTDLANIYNNLGNIYLQEGDRNEALKQYILTAKIQDSLVHDPLGQSGALANIGNIQYQMGNFDKALEYARVAQNMSAKNNLNKNLAYTSQLIGRIFRKQKKLDKALSEYEKALELYLAMGLTREACETYLSVGNIYFDKSDFNVAQKKYKTALSIAKQSSNYPMQGVIYSAIGITFQNLKNFPTAISYMDSAFTIGKKINDQYTILDSYEVLSQIYASQNKYKESLNYFQKFIDLRDSLTQAENKIEIEELELKYQNEKKTREIELLKSDKVVKEADLARHRAIQVGTLIALLSVVIISILLINRYRVMNRANRLLEVERVRNNIARDLHDDIGSTLSSINILSQVALVEESGNTQTYLKRIGDQSTRMMEDMSDMVWSINPRNDSMDKVITRMREFATEIFDSSGIDYQFSEKVKSGLSLNADTRKNLFLIFKETVNNAAKYSKATEVEIELNQQGEILLLRIKDNGQGFDESTITSGNGLHNLRERAKEINGIITLKSIPGEGTEWELKLPVA